MANEMPRSDEYQGLSRKVIQYSERFNQLVQRMKKPDFSELEWASIEDMVDIANFERMGIFSSDKAAPMRWQDYKKLVTQYAGATSWEGTLRRITEVPDLVILEMTERNIKNGVPDITNTVTIYEFNSAGKLRHLDVYVMRLAD
jgi:hypothetical protein